MNEAKSKARPAMPPDPPEAVIAAWRECRRQGESELVIWRAMRRALSNQPSGKQTEENQP